MNASDLRSHHARDQIVHTVDGTSSVDLGVMAFSEKLLGENVSFVARFRSCGGVYLSFDILPGAAGLDL